MRVAAVMATVLGLVLASPSGANPLPLGEQPMYGGVERSPAHKKADDELIASVLREGRTRESGSKHAAGRGWEYFRNGDISTAIKRFNQAWLLNPENADAYHGFALVTAKRNGPAPEIEKYFKLALSKPGVAPETAVDYARFLNMQRRPFEAEAMARKAMSISPKARNARAQLSYSYLNRREFERACDWGRQAKENGDQLDPANYLDLVCRRAAN